jgi:hypothetical protein
MLDRKSKCSRNAYILTIKKQKLPFVFINSRKDFFFFKKKKEDYF